MPKAYPDDTELYQSDIDERSEWLRAHADDSKWIVDLAAIIALGIASNTLLFTLLFRLFASSDNLRLWYGVLAASVLMYATFRPAFTAVNVTTDMLLLRFRQKVRIPHDIEERNVIIKAVWNSIRQTIHLVAYLGSSLVFAELSKAGVGG